LIIYQLLFSPWNYPVNLAIVPLAGAIAAGNSVFIKFSRHSQSTGETFAKLLPQYIDTRAIAVESEGGARFITKLIESQWDYIFFTGSVSVGTIIYQVPIEYNTYTHVNKIIYLTAEVMQIKAIRIGSDPKICS
jgi:acyl-CoA reductase-like NAD-dependent aldehyde dehydrogenase